MYINILIEKKKRTIRKQAIVMFEARKNTFLSVCTHT